MVQATPLIAALLVAGAAVQGAKGRVALRGPYDSTHGLSASGASASVGANPDVDAWHDAELAKIETDCDDKIQKIREEKRQKLEAIVDEKEKEAEATAKELAEA